MKAMKYVLIAVAVLLVACLIGVSLGLLLSNGLLLGRKLRSDDALSEPKTYEITGNITDLDMEIECAEVKITHGEAFKVESNIKHLTVTEELGVLKIEEHSKVKTNNKVNRWLTLYVPNTIDADGHFTFRNVEIETGVGSLEIGNLYTNRLNLDLGTGRTEIANLNVTDFAEIDGGVGELTVHSGQINNLDLELGVGEAYISAELLGNSKIKSGVGEACLKLRGKQEDYSVFVTKGLGEATVFGKSAANGEKIGTGTQRIEITGGVGAIEVEMDHSTVSAESEKG